MTRDWLLGFPPVLLAQDDQMPCSDDEGLYFPLGYPERVISEYKTRAGYWRTRELLAFERDIFHPEITEADCGQVELQRVTYVGGTSPTGATFVSTGPNEWMMFDEVTPPLGITFTPSDDPQPGASPISPPGVWRKTAEHKPPVGSEHLTRYTGRGCEKAPDVRPLVWNGEVWLQGAAKIGSCALRDWLDTSGEFKVGDRVRVKDGVVSEFCKPGMVGTVKIAGRSVWFRADGEETDFCATDWLEHA